MNPRATFVTSNQHLSTTIQQEEKQDFQLDSRILI